MKHIELKESSFTYQKGKIIDARQLTEHEKFFEISLADGCRLDHEPGQFVTVMIPGFGEAPISVCSSPTKRDSFDLVVRNVGALTNELCKMQIGDTVGIRGPFGNGFSTEILIGNDLLFVAGGLGIVPLRSLINFVYDNRRDFGKVTILLGSRSPKDMLFGDEVASWQKRIDINFNCTVDKSDPDWKGNIGVITSLIPGVTLNPIRTFAVVVGPPVMYKYVVKELLDKEIPENQILLSLERHMKCGVGKCGRCQLGEYYCCQHGPVFTYKQLKGKREALELYE